jgi:hypothetical protein
MFPFAPRLPRAFPPALRDAIDLAVAFLTLDDGYEAAWDAGAASEDDAGGHTFGGRDRRHGGRHRRGAPRRHDSVAAQRCLSPVPAPPGRHGEGERGAGPERGFSAPRTRLS